MIKIFIPILALVAVLSLSACTKEESNNQGKQKNPNKYKTTSGSTLIYSVITLQDGRQIECLEKNDFTNKYGLNCNWNKPINKKDSQNFLERN